MEMELTLIGKRPVEPALEPGPCSVRLRDCANRPKKVARDGGVGYYTREKIESENGRHRLCPEAGKRDDLPHEAEMTAIWHWQ